MTSAVDVAVIGGGVAGLVAARAAAAAGATVTLLEAADHFGGLVGHHRLAGLTLDSGAESFATRGGHVASLARELGLDEVTPTPVPARVLFDGTLHPLPRAGILGIPTDLDAAGLAEVLGADGLARAREDLTLPVTHGRDTARASLAALVRSRMGTAVLDRLVRPIVRGVHSVEPEELRAEVLLPGIGDRLATHGSLAGALADIRAASPAGSAVAGIDGGVHRLTGALADDLTAHGVTLMTASRALAAHRTPGGWSMTVTAPDGAARHLQATSLVLATAPHTWPALPDDLTRLGADWPPPQQIDLLTLVLRAGDLPPHERAGTLVADPGQGAKALTYASAKWEWVQREAGPDRAVVRLSYGTDPDGAPIVPAAEPDSQHPLAQHRLALRDAARLTGTAEAWPGHALEAVAHTRLTPPAPVLGWETSQRVGPLREASDAVGNLHLTGAWICGSGLASVVPHAQAAGTAAAP
ncbi:FAD-dependent oxidoreductase [Ruania alkalisoli]|uniref:FAD-dependent oxidoreductase n=1 Tax=Ruania alkalisoli TaxID=2779775 RepID=A0A7M1SSH2_9MICO|nr:FAD-dependent oxidoreductase [Ruania alkalisoli]QOR69543.1 FAD-dependent oxidoreductase [Ruania alkalisoli]